MTSSGGSRIPGPIVVGGSGGSGTRLVARLLMAAGVHLGEDLNEQLDNVWFTLLLKRPAWRRRVVSRDPGQIDRHLQVLARALCGEALSEEDLRLASTAAVEMASVGHDHGGSGTGGWPFQRVASMASSSGPDADDRAWGWKEPNSHIYLPELARTFPDIRYVHVIRNGLDVAHGNNHNQLFNWWPDFGMGPPADGPDPSEALRFWVLSNGRALELGRALLGERLVVVNYNDLCARPAIEVPRLYRALDLSVDRSLTRRLARLPRQAPSHATAEDVLRHDRSDLEAVGAMGFQLPVTA